MSNQQNSVPYLSVVVVSVFLVTAGLFILSGAPSYLGNPIGWLIVFIASGGLLIGVNGLKNSYLEFVGRFE